MRLRSTALVALALLATGCAHRDHFDLGHHRTPGKEARIVVLPVVLPPAVATDGMDRSLSSIYSTTLLKSYEILEYDRFEQILRQKNLTLDSLLVGAEDVEVVEELDIDGILLSEVYEWIPGKPGFWFLKKSGRIGFQARLVNLRSGSVVWSLNRVVDTKADDSLSTGLGVVFKDLATALPRNLTPF